MKFSLPIVTACVFLVTCEALAQSVHRSADTWLPAADQLPSFPHSVEVELRVDRVKIAAYEPVIARITLTNRSAQLLSLEVRDDGAPFLLASLVARRGDEFERHHQWLRRSGPHHHAASLAPGESTEGEILILMGRSHTGFPFAEPGKYVIKFACQPDGRFAPVYTNTVAITVSPVNRNELLLEELGDLVYAHFGLDRESVVRSNGGDYMIGIRLLQKVIRQRTPHLIDPDRNPDDLKERELVEALTVMLSRHPDSSYSGYIARFLGLVHIKTFEHEGSLGGAGSWSKTKNSPDHADVRRTAQAAYVKALRYLTIAKNADLWPRTTAIENLSRLHTMAEEWDRVTSICEELRVDYAEYDGEILAVKIENRMAKYRARLDTGP